MANRQQIERGLDYLIMELQANNFNEERLTHYKKTIDSLNNQGYNVSYYQRFYEEVQEMKNYREVKNDK